MNGKVDVVADQPGVQDYFSGDRVEIPAPRIM